MNERILFYRLGALGDTLLTLPALDALRLRYPGAHITLAAHPGYAAPLKDAGRVDAVLDAGSVPFHLLQLTPSAGKDELDRLLARFSTLALFTRDPEEAVFCRLRSNFPGRWLVTSPFPPEKEEVHTADWLIRSLKPLGVSPGTSATAPLQPSPDSREEARHLLRDIALDNSPILGIHPGGGGRAKWPPPGALARIAKDYCRKSPTQPFLIRGPADGEACGAFLSQWGDTLPILETTRLEVLAGALAETDAYLGGDSGVTHLAALCGAPALALFGPASDPVRWGPLGGRSKCIHWDQAEKGSEFLGALAAE
jgi:ADP-heptose:LPS heptosyltransferase